MRSQYRKAHFTIGVEIWVEPVLTTTCRDDLYLGRCIRVAGRIEDIEFKSSVGVGGVVYPNDHELHHIYPPLVNSLKDSLSVISWHEIVEVGYLLGESEQLLLSGNLVLQETILEGRVDLHPLCLHIHILELLPTQ